MFERMEFVPLSFIWLIVRETSFGSSVGWMFDAWDLIATRFGLSVRMRVSSRGERRSISRSSGVDMVPTCDRSSNTILERWRGSNASGTRNSLSLLNVAGAGVPPKMAIASWRIPVLWLLSSKLSSFGGSFVARGLKSWLCVRHPN